MDGAPRRASFARGSGAKGRRGKSSGVAVRGGDGGDGSRARRGVAGAWWFSGRRRRRWLPSWSVVAEGGATRPEVQREAVLTWMLHALLTPLRLETNTSASLCIRDSCYDELQQRFRGQVHKVNQASALSLILDKTTSKEEQHEVVPAVNECRNCKNIGDANANINSSLLDVDLDERTEVASSQWQASTRSYMQGS